MRAIYNCSFADPWVMVAEQLKAKYALEPVYWIGYADDDSDRLVRQAFPAVVYHAYFDAWKGVFPDGLEEGSWAFAPEPEEYGCYAEYELQALQLMDRMDFDQRSFSFAERRLLFRKFIRCWTYIVEHLRIDALISPNIPHRSFDFPLYLVCRRKGIKMISFMSTPFMKSGRILALSDLYHMPERIKLAFQQKQESKTEQPLSEDTRGYLSRVKQNYEAAKPENFREYNRHHRRKPSVFLTGRKFFFEILGKNSPWLGRNGWLFNGVPSYHKSDRQEVEHSRSRQNLASYMAKIYRRIRYLKRLELEYRKSAVKPDFTKKYVILALHYQPEATTAPRAGIFTDQLYVLELMSRHLPKDWSIYVKENPKQFNPIAEGNTGRPLRFYSDALNIPRVSFVPIDADPFALIDRALAVFSVAGTIGWEGMVRGKPVVCFGPSWYEHYAPGVLRVRNEADLESVPAFIERYLYDEPALQRYLKTIEEQSLCAYFRRGLKRLMSISEKECVESLQASVACRLGLTKGS
jgi:hypothetical protein